MNLVGPVVSAPRIDRDAAVTALFRREHGRLVAFARLFVDDQQSAEDVVQDAFAGLYRRWSSLSDDQAALPYLRTAVANGSRSQLRRRRTVRLPRPSTGRRAVRRERGRPPRRPRTG